jgi:hypothetical protein
MMLHESEDADRELPIGSDRSFGFVFAGASVFFGILIWPNVVATIALWAAAVVLVLVALVRPTVLHPANVVWMRFGAVLQRVVQPVVLGSFFFLLFTPFALLRRALGRTPVDVSFDKEAVTYWRSIDAAQQQEISMKNQF